MVKQSLSLAAAFCLLAGCSQSTEQLGGRDSVMLSSGDNSFFKNITIGNETEIESSQLATTQSQNASVKDFAQSMIKDHHMAGEKVSALARDKSVMLPTKLDDSHQKMVDELKGKSGAEFDKAYTDLQIAAHKDTISLDEDEANNGSDPQVKALANELLPTLRMHLQMAQQLQPGM